MTKLNSKSLIVALYSYAGQCNSIEDLDEIDEKPFIILYNELRNSLNTYIQNSNVYELKSISESLPNFKTLKPEKSIIDTFLFAGLFVLSPMLLVFAYFYPLLYIPTGIWVTIFAYGNRMRTVYLSQEVNHNVKRISELFSAAAQIITNVEKYEEQ